MAAYTLNAGEVSAHAKTLAAATVDTVTLGVEASAVKVTMLSGTDPIYFRCDGQNPAIAGAYARIVAPMAGQAVTVNVVTPGLTKVTLIAAGASSYSVEAVER